MTSLLSAPFAILLAAAAVAAPGAAAPPNSAGPPPDEIVLRRGLALPGAGRSGRSAIHRDAIEAALVAGKRLMPREGDAMLLPDGSSARWEPIAADAGGQFSGRALRGSYADFQVHLDVPKTLILDAAGDSMAYVNGEPRFGDVYETGWSRLPIALHAGDNDLLFLVQRGRLRAKLTAPDAPVALDSRDTTLPDLLIGERTRTWGALVVTNATGQMQIGLRLSTSGPGLKTAWTPLPPIAPLSTRKVAFRIDGAAPRKEGTRSARIELFAGEDGKKLDEATVALRVRRPDQAYKTTFRSALDDSVQYYAVNPQHPLGTGGDRPALFLSLHGAGVEAIGQADAYESKSWGVLVAPTNRRPYGFDWEEWGRLDAMEVLGLAKQRFHPDPRRIYLTGHSMGGHGTWQVGSTYPDQFAAIGPSAGWISIWSYAGGARSGPSDPAEAMLRRASAPSDTLALAPNLADDGVYVLHGTADDNVPISEARTMVARLAEFHHDVVFHEQPGAGHWWDVSDEPGADCVDWAPMFDFFARHSCPSDESVRAIDFITASPGVSSRSRWAEVLGQIHPLERSEIHLRVDPGLRRFSGTTENVSHLALRAADALQSGAPATLILDGQMLGKVPWPSGGAIRLSRSVSGEGSDRKGGLWIADTGPPSPLLKNPERYGPFKSVFRNRPVLVYGTAGTPEENAWSFAKARYDDEAFRYIGNASFDLIADSAFDLAAYRDRNVVLYGNAETNRAWGPLLAGSPIEVRRGSVTVGGRKVGGPDAACLFIRPRPGSERALVGAVSGASLVGMRLTDRLSYFSLGADFPDWIVFGPRVLMEGPAAVADAGFFGMDWSLESGDAMGHGAPLHGASPAG